MHWVLSCCVGRQRWGNDNAEHGHRYDDKYEACAAQDTKKPADTDSQSRRDSSLHNAYPYEGDALPPPAASTTDKTILGQYINNTDI